MSSSTVSKFEKIMHLYAKKYDMNIKNFILFLNEQTNTTEIDISQIQQKIIQMGLQKKKFDNNILSLCLNMLAAKQSGLKLCEVQINNLSFYREIKLKSKKQKNEYKKTFEYKQEQNPSIKLQTQQTYQTKKYIKQKMQQNYKLTSNASKNQYPRLNQQLKNTLKKQTNQQQFPNSNHNKFQSPKVETNEIKQPRNSQQNISPLFSKPFQKKIKISSYQKMGHDYLNAIIKFRIQYNNQFVVFRRFSQFEKLLQYLSTKYEGCALPQLPPKQGLKHNFSYFWGIDQQFLNDRQNKLQSFLNTLIESKFLTHDSVLNNFLTKQYYEVPQDANSQPSYLKSIISIATSTQQIKDYSIAYYNYLNDGKRKQIVTLLTQQYYRLQQIFRTFEQFQQYRKIINQNYSRRRELMKRIGVKVKEAVNSQFDRIIEETVLEMRNINNEYKKYIDLKEQEGWLMQLIAQKKISGSSCQQLEEKLEKHKNRILILENNFMLCIADFFQSKTKILPKLAKLTVVWRKAVHP